jgi:hypothetical protein
MSTDLQDLKRRMAALPADELLDLLAFDAAEYRSDALNLAREELHKRGYDESDLENWRGSATRRRSYGGDLRFGRMRFLLILVLTAIVTFCLFTPLIYYSIILYGIPCAIFIAVGYLIWLALRKSDPQGALAFAIGFACGVSVMLLACATEVPWYICLIVGEFLCLWILIKIDYAGCFYR